RRARPLPLPYPPRCRSQTEALMDGRAVPTGLSGAFVARVLGDGAAWLSTLQGFKRALTDTYFHLTNRSGSEVAVLGPAKITAVYKRPPTSESAQGSVLVAFNVAGDEEDDVLSIESTETT